jgi:hypothetical protein
MLASTYGSIRPSELSQNIPDPEDAESETERLYHDSPIPIESRFFVSSGMLKLCALLACLSIALLPNVHSWTMPKNAFVNAAAVATLSAAIASAALPASAVDFSGSYADPFHPNCKRDVQVVSTSKADVTGTDGTPGCPPDGSGRKWALTGIIDGDTILIDFTPKGGPKDLKGVWEPSPVPGIRFPDGNLWSKKATIE